MTTVFIVWDYTCEVSGEKPDMVNIYSAKEIANEVCDGMELDPERAVEERVVEDEAVM